jgi:pyrimidine operon attenuation protein/uracil phosphoribosyltransferase
MAEKVLLNAAHIDEAVRRLANEACAAAPDRETFAVVGIQTRGVYLAKRICAHIEKSSGVSVRQGVLDITFYRDDLASRGTLPVIKETKIDFDIDGMTILLVDDVLYTGRTIKAALDTLTDYGRPRRILLAVLADRGNRELPIQADFTGMKVPTGAGDRVIVRLSEVDGIDQVVLAGEK